MSLYAWPEVKTSRLASHFWFPILWLVVCFFACPALAQRSDSFEGGPPRWLLVESDCSAQIAAQQISSVAPHSGRTSELIELACRNGTAALLAYPLEKTLPLDEFQPRLWTRCSSGGVRIGIRIVFPASRHPVTGGRLTTILWGETYDAPGQWQALGVTGVEGLLQQEGIALRQRFGGDVDLEAAFIDAIVLNAYTGPGRYRLQVDSLTLNGLVPLSATGVPVAPDWRRRWQWRERLPTANERFWATKSQYGVWLAHGGESFPWLKSIGITGVMLQQLPTPDELALAASNGIEVLSPPPEQPVDFVAEDRRAIRGWVVGTAMDADRFDDARNTAHLVARLGEDYARPLIAETLEEHWRFARVVDEVFVPQVARISPGSTVAKQQWMTEKLSALRPRSGGWVTVSADVEPGVQSQYDAAQQAIFPKNTPERLASPLESYLQTISAVVSGARSIMLRANRELVDGEPGQHAQIAAVRLANMQLQHWSPWTAHGQITAPPQVTRPDYAATAWSVSESRLVIAAVATETSQFCVPPTSAAPLELAVDRLTDDGRVYRITSGRMQEINAAIQGSRLSWAVETPAPVEAFVITSNPLVLRYLQRKSRETLASNSADCLTIAEYQLQIASRIVDARFDSGPNEMVNMAAAEEYLRRLAVAQRAIDSANARMRSRDLAGAMTACEVAWDSIQSVIAQSHEVAIENLSTPQSSPFVLTPSTLHMHWQMAVACERSTWRDVVIPGARFEDLQSMLDGGWGQQRRQRGLTDLRVELVPAGKSSPGQMVASGRSVSMGGNGGLRMAAYRKPSAEPEIIEGGYEGATLLVRSAAAEIPGGHLVRVSATAQILRSNDRWDAGILVYDNQAGPSMGQLVNGQAGEEKQIELYRFMAADGSFRIFAECRGECDAILTNLRVSIIKPAQNTMTYQTEPATIGPELNTLPIGDGQ